MLLTKSTGCFIATFTHLLNNVSQIGDIANVYSAVCAYSTSLPLHILAQGATHPQQQTYQYLSILLSVKYHEEQYNKGP